MNTVKKIQFIFDRSQKIRLAILAIITLVGALLELVGISVIMPFAEIISDTSVIHKKKIYSAVFWGLKFQDESQFILFFSIGLIAIYIFKNVYLVCMYDVQFRFTYNNQRRLVKRLAKCYLNQTYLFHVSKNITELQRNVIDDVSMFIAAVLGAIQFFTESMVCLLLIIYLFVLDRFITIGVVIVLSVFTLVYLKLFKNRTIYYGAQNRDTNAERNKWIRQAFEGIKEIKIVNREQYYLDRIDKCSIVFADAIRKSSLISLIPRPLFEAVCVSTLMVIVMIKLLNGMNVKDFVPVLSTFVVASFRLLPSFGRLTGSLNNIVYNKTAIDAVYHDLKEADELSTNALQLSSEEQLYLRNEIQINNLTFMYPNTSQKVLDNVSLSIPANSSVAFIGPSGAGKTTLVDIVLGLLEPVAGNVLVDGESIYDRMAGWHKSLGYIPQNIYLMDDSIRNNILFGIPEKEANEEAILKAIEDAQLKDFIENLDEGLDTVVGERGVRLSGGQRQRIGIARALYNNPDVLVLDEATSALDNETESAVMDAINNLRGKKTLIIIAHRLSTIENCDIKYKVSDGKVEKVL